MSWNEKSEILTQPQSQRLNHQATESLCSAFLHHVHSYWWSVYHLGRQCDTLKSIEGSENYAFSADCQDITHALCPLMLEWQFSTIVITIRTNAILIFLYFYWMNAIYLFLAHFKEQDEKIISMHVRIFNVYFCITYLQCRSYICISISGTFLCRRWKDSIPARAGWRDHWEGASQWRWQETTSQ